MKPLPLSRSVVDQAANRRGESLLALARDPATRVVLLRSGRVATSADGEHLDLWAPARLAAVGPADDAGAGPVDGAALWLFLGRHEEVTYLAAVLPAPVGGADPADPAGEDDPDAVVPGLAGCTWSTLRDVGHLLGDVHADLATTALALSEWHRRTTRCPRCGAPTRVELGGWVRRCSVDGGEEHPRTDAAVIMAVTDDADRILLAHGAQWAERRFSTLAGFVEPGESLETAVRREVGEEVGVQVGEVAYVASQPWPFPASLMVGFRARATTTQITVDRHEVTDARWFTRADLYEAVRDGDVTLPMHTSIARALIEEWYGGPVDRAPADGAPGS